MHSDHTDDISRCLLEERNTDPSVKNNDGDTPLHVACSNKKFKAVQLLVRDQRCNPNEKNNDGDTALHIACRLSYEDVTRGRTKCTLQCVHVPQLFSPIIITILEGCCPNTIMHLRVMIPSVT